MKFLETYFRCADGFLDITQAEPLSTTSGYFGFGANVVCYGKVAKRIPSESPLSISYDAEQDVVLSGSGVQLPFDIDQLIGNLYFERYTRQPLSAPRRIARQAIRHLYYTFRPSLPAAVKILLQKWYLNGWNRLTFPRWPVDHTVDILMRRILELSLSSGKVTEIPFIWFWPNGATACAVMTHDVETESGIAATEYIMNTDQSYDIPSSFQIVPEGRYPVTSKYLDGIRERSFEVNVQDLDHDGRLFDDIEEFKKRAAKINAHRKCLRANGFRSAVLYRNQDWYDHLDFDYDMSVPNVAHLDPQRGGCCTVLPYFIGDMVELPVTTTQDYTLFYIFENYELDLWHEQIASILRFNGLISFIIHPDYMRAARAQRVYEALLKTLGDLRRESNSGWLRPAK